MMTKEDYNKLKVGDYVLFTERCCDHKTEDIAEIVYAEINNGIFKIQTQIVCDKYPNHNGWINNSSIEMCSIPDYNIVDKFLKELDEEIR